MSTVNQPTNRLSFRKGRRLTILLVCTAPLLVWLYALQQTPADLKTLTIDASGWVSSGNQRYWWLSGDTLLFQKQDPGGAYNLLTVEVSPASSRQSPTLLVAGGRSPMDVMSVSPQGRYILFRRDSKTEVVSCFCTTDRTTRRWAETVADVYTWSPDSRRVLEIVTDDVGKRIHQVVLRNGDNPNDFHVTSIAKAAPFDQDFFHFGGVCLTRDGHYWMGQEIGTWHPVKSVTLLEGSIQTPNVLIAQHRVTLPTGDGSRAIVRCTAYKPTSDASAWFLFNRRLPLWQHLFEQLVGYSYRDPSPWAQTTLWISNVDGTQMRNIGTLSRGSQAPEELTWSVDGKRLAFLQGDMLQITPVQPITL